MNMHSFHPRLVIIVGFIFLTGCPQSEAPPQASAAIPKYLAVARGRVDVEGGLLKLGVTRDGRVVEVNVKEGDRVKKGHLLATLASEPARLAVIIAQAEQQQIRLRAKQLERQFEFAKQKAKRLTKAAAIGAGDGQSADDAHEAAAQLQDEIEKNQGDAEMVVRKLITAHYELAQHSLRAPVDAEVIRSQIQPGTTVSPLSGTAFILLPNLPQIIRAELNESFGRAVVPGMKAEVFEDSSNDQLPLSAHVVRISAVLGGSTLEDDPQVRANMRTLECILALDQAAPSTTLRVGQQVLVRFEVKP